MNDVATIFAPATGHQAAAIAVIRVSGPRVRSGLVAVTGQMPAPRFMALRTLREPDGGEIDRGLVVFFPGPASFDGYDAAELHVHGGPAVVARVVAVLAALPGFRLAEPGEFTRRALENGKLDLAEVEGLGDLVAAETEAQRRQALDRMSGRVSSRVEDWRDRLIRVRAMLEAAMDFSDEDDVPGDVDMGLDAEIQALRAEIGEELASRVGERVRTGCEIVVLGPPNAGKSSLVNALARRDVAIVSETPGTTRDLIEVRLDLGGVPVTVVDTAGLREASGDTIEREGMLRARRRAAAADVRLALVDLADPLAPEPADLVVGNKADLVGGSVPDGIDIAVSVATGAGMERLLEELSERANALTTAGEGVVVTRQRHREILGACVAALDEALAPRETNAPELRAEALRRAGDALGRITGRVGVEDLLDVIFRDFCIGK